MFGKNNAKKYSKPMNSSKNKLNSSKNKLNSEIILIFHPRPNAHLGFV